MSFFTYNEGDLWSLIAVLLVTSISIILGVLLQYIIFKLLNFYQKRKHTFIIPAYIRRFKYPLYIFMPALLAVIFMPDIPNTKIDDFFHGVAKVILIITLAVILIRAVYLAVDWLTIRYQIDKVDGFKERALRTQLHLIKRFLIVLISVICLSLLLISFESVRELGEGILASATVVTGIIIFSAQKVLGNILAGLQIAFTQPIRLGDVVIVEKEYGVIEDITLTYVVVKIWDERRLVLPISYFIEKPFENWTRYSTELIGTIFLYADYRINVDLVREEFNRVVTDAELWDKRVKALQVTDAKNETIELRMLVSASTAARLWDLRCYVREKMIDYIQKRFPDCLPRRRNETIYVAETDGNGGNPITPSQGEPT